MDETIQPEDQKDEAKEIACNQRCDFHQVSFREKRGAPGLPPKRGGHPEEDSRGERQTRKPEARSPGLRHRDSSSSSQQEGNSRMAGGLTGSEPRLVGTKSTRFSSWAFAAPASGG